MPRKIYIDRLEEQVDLSDKHGLRILEEATARHMNLDSTRDWLVFVLMETIENPDEEKLAKPLDVKF